MKCVCGAKMKGIRTELELFDGSVTVRDVEAWRCPKCKEDLFTSGQGDKVREKLVGVLPVQAFHVRKKVAKVGNSIMIPVPKDIADFLHLGKDSELELTVKSGHRLIVDTV